MPNIVEKVAKVKVKIDNTADVEAFRAEGGGLFHVLPTGRRRGMTVAYKVKSRRVEIATSVQHSHDTFTRKIGTKVALEHFKAGKIIVLPFDGDIRNLRWFFDVL